MTEKQIIQSETEAEIARLQKERDDASLRIEKLKQQIAAKDEYIKELERKNVWLAGQNEVLNNGEMFG